MTENSTNPTEDLAAASATVKEVLESAGLEIYMPPFIARAQEEGSRIHGFGVKDPQNFTRAYEVDIWRDKVVFLKSIWPARDLNFEEQVRQLLTESGFEKLRFAEYTH